jgi:hypothetical protein
MLNQRELAEYFRAEFRRLLRDKGEFSSPAVVVDAPAAPPAPHGRVTMFGELKYAKPVPMSVPPCLCKPDSELGQARRFSHARQLVEKLSKGPKFYPHTEVK